MVRDTRLGLSITERRMLRRRQRHQNSYQRLPLVRTRMSLQKRRLVEKNNLKYKEPSDIPTTVLLYNPIKYNRGTLKTIRKP